MNRSIRKSRKVRDLPLTVVPIRVTPGRSCGLVYVAYGPKAVKGVSESIVSARKFHPGLAAAVVSDRSIPGVSVTLVNQPDTGDLIYEYKTLVYELSPFDLTLFLDADTQVVGSLQAGFTALDKGWDLAAALDLHPVIGEIDYTFPDDKAATLNCIGVPDYPHVNSGMLFFRKSVECEEAFKQWNREWARFKYRDQAAFQRAVFLSDATMYILGWQWNTHKQRFAKHIYHNHHSVDRTWQGVIAK
jgi:hypothetical protein